PEGTPPEVTDSLRPQCQDEQTQLQRQLSSQYRDITLPGSIPDALNLGLPVAVILLAILTSSHLGAEYAWGTVRTNLVRGIGRWRYLAAKLILLALVSAAALLAIVVLTAMSSLVARHFAPPPSELARAASWSRAAAVLGKGWVALIPYLLLTALATLLARSSAAGMAISIGYYMGEHVVVAIVGGLSGRTQTVARYLLGQNIDAWAGLSLLGLGHTKVGNTHALLVLVAYAMVLACAAFYVFERRDVAGASAA
ncbi:MAG TPA: ABC transporter permease subunit, partial [Dehalococcoidia bacterium]|nr:ABC transporter permease subunit [Dehalococcoidia bacterium]